MWPTVALGPLGCATGGITAPVNPGGLCDLRKRRVGRFLPQGPHAITGPFFGQHRHTLAGFDIAVADDQVRMRVARILPRLMDRRQPRRQSRCQFFSKTIHKGAALLPVELAGQRQHDLVDDTGVLAV